MCPRLLIILLLLWLATPLATAQALLTLGAAPGATPGLQSAEQARQLSAALSKALGEAIELRLFAERLELDQAMIELDLAIYNASFLAEHPDRYLVIGAADRDGKLLVISRQGRGGDLTQRVAAALSQPLTESQEMAAAEPVPAPRQVVADSYSDSATPVEPPPPIVFPELPAGLEIPVTPMLETTPAPVAVAAVEVAHPETTEGAPQPAATPPVASRERLIAGEVPAIIAQPAIPQELRPPGVPLPRPGRLPSAPPPKDEIPALLSNLPEKIGRTQKPAPLLPEPDPEPGIVYVVPFISLMVPEPVKEWIFDRFVDTLNQTGANRNLRFVILKESLDKIDRDWLNARKYVFGEIYGYVEESGCCSTDLRAKTRLTYYRAHHPEPTLRYEYPIRTFFDHDRSNIETERHKLADQIASALVAELTKALQP